MITRPVSAAQSPAAAAARGKGSGPDRQKLVTAAVGAAHPVRVDLIRSASRPVEVRFVGRDAVRDRLDPLRLAGPCDARLTALGSHPSARSVAHTRRMAGLAESRGSPPRRPRDFGHSTPAIDHIRPKSAMATAHPTPPPRLRTQRVSQ